MNNYAMGYQHYKEQSVNTMTQGEMLILLYDEAIKRLTRAEFALEKKDYVVFDASVERTKEIFRYLTDTLDKRYPISQEILKLYDFVAYELGRIKASRNAEIIKELKPLILDFRDTFKEADRLNNMK